LARREYAGNAPATTLSGAITATTTSITVADATGYPTGSVGPFAVILARNTADEEKILVSSRSGNTLTCTLGNRGYDGTSAVQHPAGTPVEHCATAVDLDEANAHVNATASAHAASAITFTPAGGVAATTVQAAVEELDAEKSAAGHTHAKTVRVDKTWAYDGTAAVNTLPGFYVSLPAGQSAVLALARHATGAGSATVSVRKNGTAVAGLDALSVSTTATTTDPADVAVADGDYLDLHVSAVSSASDLRFSLFLDLTV
jgi:hypothetical protein